MWAKSLSACWRQLVDDESRRRFRLEPGRFWRQQIPFLRHRQQPVQRWRRQQKRRLCLSAYDPCLTRLQVRRRSQRVRVDELHRPLASRIPWTAATGSDFQDGPLSRGSRPWCGSPGQGENVPCLSTRRKHQAANERWLGAQIRSDNALAQGKPAAHDVERVDVKNLGSSVETMRWVGRTWTPGSSTAESKTSTNSQGASGLNPYRQPIFVPKLQSCFVAMMPVCDKQGLFRECRGDGLMGRRVLNSCEHVGAAHAVAIDGLG